MSSSSSFPKRFTILTHQFEQLRALVRNAVGDNPFYTRKLQEAGSSTRLRDLSDLSESIPLTTRAELRDDCQANPPFGSNLTWPISRFARCHQTADEQGKPHCWLDTTQSWEAAVANGTEVFHAAGVSAGDRIFFSSSFEEHAGAGISLDSGGISGGLCFSGAGQGPALHLQSVLAMGITVLCGSPASLLRLADAAREGNADTRSSPLRIVITGGELHGAARVRAAMTPLWPEARVFEYYALPEAGVMAFECPVRTGVLHMIEPAILAEVIALDTLKPVDSGQAGELIVTTLFRPGSPLLRYRTGHLVRLAQDSVCECGRHHLALDGGILGPVGG